MVDRIVTDSDLMDCDFFISTAAKIFGRPLGRSTHVINRRFRALFGVSSKVCVQVWELLTNKILQLFLPKHFLRSRLFMKSYSNEAVLSAMTGVDKKTQRYYIWVFIKSLARLRIVRFFISSNH